MVGAAAARRESGRPAGRTVRDGVGETDRWGSRGRRGGKRATRRWSRGQRGVSRGTRSCSRWRPGGRPAGEAGARGGWGVRRVRETEGGIRSAEGWAGPRTPPRKSSPRQKRRGLPGVSWSPRYRRGGRHRAVLTGRSFPDPGRAHLPSPTDAVGRQGHHELQRARCLIVGASQSGTGRSERLCRAEDLRIEGAQIEGK